MRASPGRPMSDPLLDVRGLRVEFDAGRNAPTLRAVDGVDLTVSPRETVGLVGESGSGKTTIGRAILGLTPITGGAVSFGGTDITYASTRQRRRLSAELQVVFQDPYSSLNPTRSIGDTLAESLRAHGRKTRADTIDQVHSMLAQVGLPAQAADRYPAQFSGGQRQRIAIARALMVEPKLVVCDEPVSALDLSVQAQVLNLLRELQDELGMGYLFIAHDLAVVRHLSHRIVVLYRGQVMEQGDAETMHTRPKHPYTQTLLDAVLLPDPGAQRQRRLSRRRLAASTGQAARDGCPFAPRCQFATSVCGTKQPRLEPATDGTLVACHHWRELVSEQEGTRR